MVVEYRKLNENLKPDRFPLTRVDTVFDTLGTTTYFSSMDINHAFFQQPIVPEDRGYSAFVTHKGLYQYTRLPIGM